MNTLHRVLLAAALGMLAIHATYGEEIINGTDAKDDFLQFMACVQRDGIHRCGGFLIHPSFVLTAAHCHKLNKNITVVLGNHNIDPKQGNLRRYATKAIIHESYNGNVQFGYDIMLLKIQSDLSTKIKQDKNVKTVEIPKNGKPVKSGSKCVVAGWGRTEKHENVYNLRMTYVSTVNSKTCQDEWNKKNIEYPANVLCAGGNKSKGGACQRDSGGPLVCKKQAVGIVSFNWGKNCEHPDVPNVYTDISKYRAWINQKINEGV